MKRTTLSLLALLALPALAQEAAPAPAPAEGPAEPAPTKGPVTTSTPKGGGLLKPKPVAPDAAKGDAQPGDEAAQPTR